MDPFEEYQKNARRDRDAELGPAHAPAFRLSDVKRRQRPVGLLMLALMLVWIASIFGAIAIIRPLMVSRSGWYGLLIVAYMIVSFVAFGYAVVRAARWFGLVCPYCGDTFMYLDLKGSPKDLACQHEDKRRCSRCHAVIIDLDS